MTVPEQPKSLECTVLAWMFTGAVIASLVGGAAVTIIACSKRYLSDEVLLAMVLTPIVTLLMGVFGIASTHAMRRGRLMWLMRATIVAVVIAAGVSVAALWWHALWARRFLPMQPQMLGSISLVVIVTVISGQLLVQRIDSQMLRLGQLAASGSVAFLGVVGLTLIWSWPAWEHWEDQVLLATTMWVLATGLFIAIVALLMQREIKPTKIGRESIPDRIKLRLLCPNCNAEQTLATGRARCGVCRYVMMIEIEEPRCECGYLIYRLVGETCPECGRAVLKAGTTHEAAQVTPAAAETPSPAPGPPG